MQLAYVLTSGLFALGGYLCRGRLFNPLTVFSLIWLTIASLNSLQLSAWQSDLSARTYWVLLAMIVSFGVCYLLGDYVRMRKTKEPVVRRRVDINTVQTLFVVWFLGAVVEVGYSGGLPILWHLTGSSRTYFDFGIPSLHGVLNSLGLVIVLVSVHLALNDKQHTRKLIVLCLFVLTYYLCLVTRQVLVSAIIEIIAILLIRQVRMVVRWLLPVAIVAVLMFGLVGNARTGYQAFIYVSLLKPSLPAWLSGVYWVYMYLTMTLTNIDSLLSSGLPPIGADALNGFVPSAITRMLGGGSVFFTAEYLVTPAFNVSGFFVSFLRGFALPGVIVISSTYGYLSGVINRNVVDDPSERNVLMYAIVMQIVMLSFFDNMLLYLPSSFQFVIVMYLCRRMKSNK